MNVVARWVADPIPSPIPSGRAPAGWSPIILEPTPSARRPGMLASCWDAIQGKPEREDGQPLTAIQIDQMSPHLAKSFGMPEAEVRSQLEEVQLFLGGPAANTPWNAVTLGHDIYVRSEEELRAIEKWSYRGWLSHECAHVMQYVRPPEGLSETQQIRRYLGAYVTQLLVAPGCAPGALPAGLCYWLDENLNPFNHEKTHISLYHAIHDSQYLEAEAERAAQAFSHAT